MKRQVGNAGRQLGDTATNEAPKGWHSRGYLPHLDAAGTLQATITFRLADSLPQEKLRGLAQEIESLPEKRRNASRRRAIDAWLDAGIGCCALQHPEVAVLVEQTLLRFDGSCYRLLAWCVMPNHVHVLIDPLIRLSRIVQSWKSYTGRVALARNAELGLGVPGKRFWMRDYWDRFVRDQEHLDAVIAYIHANGSRRPVFPVRRLALGERAFSGPVTEGRMIADGQHEVI